MIDILIKSKIFYPHLIFLMVSSVDTFRNFNGSFELLDLEFMAVYAYINVFPDALLSGVRVRKKPGPVYGLFISIESFASEHRLICVDADKTVFF